MRTMSRGALSLALLSLAVPCVFGQQQATAPAAAATAPGEVKVDPQASAAAALIGRAVFLRCFCSDNTLSFDAAGKLAGTVKTTDWTLAAMNVQRVERKSAAVVELDGVRVAVKYDAVAHEFQRRPQADEKMRVLVADTGSTVAFQRTLEAVFAVGIDRALQQAMPAYWRHYFDPKLAWGDGLDGVTVYVPGAAGPNGTVVTEPAVSHKVAPTFTNFAQRDRVTGKTQLRFVVDADGVPRRVTITQPQGYGLDERAAEAVMKMRLTPGMRDGKPVATMVLLNQDFEFVSVPR